MLLTAEAISPVPSGILKHTLNKHLLNIINLCSHFPLSSSCNFELSGEIESTPVCQQGVVMVSISLSNK